MPRSPPSPRRDIFLQPPLGEIGSSDFARAPEAIKIGEAAARRSIARLSELSLTPPAYQAWLAAQRRQPTPLPVIADVTVDNRSPIGDEVIRAQIRTKPGEPLNMETLEKDLKRIYSIDTFEKADFRLTETGGKNRAAHRDEGEVLGASLPAFRHVALETISRAAPVTTSRRA